MKIALALVLFLEAACTVRAQMNPLGSGLQRLLVGVLGARGGGRYGNPGAAYVHQGGAAAVPQANVRQQAYAGYAPAANGRMQSRPMFGTGLLSFGAGRRGAVSGARAPGRRWRRQASAYPEDLLTRGFNIVRRLDGDRCILRACCEAAAKPGEYGDEGQLAVQFILSLRHDRKAPWQPYLMSARMGRAHGSLQLCRRIFNGCHLNRQQLDRTTRERLLKAISCLSRRC
ncbi:uncharacterized protein LOC144118465 [Amblyomma americanum]